MANLRAIYDEAVQHSHEAALSAVAAAVRADVAAEYERLKREAADAVAGVDVAALQKRAADLEAENAGLAAKNDELTKALTVADNDRTALSAAVGAASEKAATQEAELADLTSKLAAAHEAANPGQAAAPVEGTAP